MKRIIYDMPKWHVFLHRDERQLPALTRDSEAKEWLIQDEMFEKLYTGEPKLIEEPKPPPEPEAEAQAQEAEASGQPQQEAMATEKRIKALTRRARTIISPEEEERLRTKSWAEKVHKLCEEVPDFARLGEEVRGDSGASAVAVETLYKQLAPQITEEKVNQPNPFNIRQAIRKGCRAASEAVEEVREALEGVQQLQLNTGQEYSPRYQPPPEDDGEENETATVQEGRGSMKLGRHDGVHIKILFKRLKNDRRLRHIALLAGKFKRIADVKQRQKSDHARDEVSNVTQGDDIGRFLPAEVMKLTHPNLRRLLLRDLLEQKVLQYELQGTEPLGKGPIVVCLDKSGSMQGDPDTWASAVALALLDIAKKQNRVFALLNFDDAVKFKVICKPGDSLPEEGLFEFSGGGTDIDQALDVALKIILEEHPGDLKKADIVLVGDGGSSPRRAEQLKKLATDNNIDVIGIAIGMNKDVFTPWCHTVHEVSDLTTVDDHIANEIFTI